MTKRASAAKKGKLSYAMRVVILFVLVLVTVPLTTYVIAFFVTAWPPTDAMVTVDGEKVGASAQKSRDGRYLRIDYPDGLYVVDLKHSRLGWPSRTAHKVFLGYFHPEEGAFGVLVAKDFAKTEHDPHLIVERGKVSFIDMEDRRVEVSY